MKIDRAWIREQLELCDEAAEALRRMGAHSDTYEPLTPYPMSVLRDAGVVRRADLNARTNHPAALRALEKAWGIVDAWCEGHSLDDLSKAIRAFEEATDADRWARNKLRLLENAPEEATDADLDALEED